MIDPVSDMIRRLEAERPYPAIPTPDSGLPYSEQRADVLLAMLVWGEARGEGMLGMLLVGCVVRNRVRSAPRYGTDWRSVMLRPWQFSCFNSGDGNARKLREPLRYGTATEWEQACAAAYDIREGRCADITDGATHYYDVVSLKTPPSWVPGMRQTVRFRRHAFFVDG